MPQATNTVLHDRRYYVDKVCEAPKRLDPDTLELCESEDEDELPTVRATNAALHDKRYYEKIVCEAPKPIAKVPNPKLAPVVRKFLDPSIDLSTVDAVGPSPIIIHRPLLEKLARPWWDMSKRMQHDSDALRIFGSDAVYASFNGGKDACVIMHLLRAARHAHDDARTALRWESSCTVRARRSNACGVRLRRWVAQTARPRRPPRACDYRHRGVRGADAGDHARHAGASFTSVHAQPPARARRRRDGDDRGS